MVGHGAKPRCQNHGGDLWGNMPWETVAKACKACERNARKILCQVKSGCCGWWLNQLLSKRLELVHWENSQWKKWYSKPPNLDIFFNGRTDYFGGYPKSGWVLWRWFRVSGESAGGRMNQSAIRLSGLILPSIWSKKQHIPTMSLTGKNRGFRDWEKFINHIYHH